MNTVIAILVVVFLMLALAGMIESIRIIRSRGIIDYLTYKNATPALDNLELSGSSNTKHYPGLKEFIAASQSFSGFECGKIQIWGDFKGRGLNSSNIIQTIECKEDTSTLSITFTNNNKLIIQGPQHIFTANSMFKIKTADAVRWEWQETDRQNIRTSYIDYTREEKSIATETNSSWKRKKYDLLLQKPAVFIY